MKISIIIVLIFILISVGIYIDDLHNQISFYEDALNKEHEYNDALDAEINSLLTEIDSMMEQVNNTEGTLEKLIEETDLPLEMNNNSNYISEECLVATARITLGLMEDNIEDIDAKIEIINEYNEEQKFIPSIMPTKGIISSYFGNRTIPYGGGSSQFHTGIDIRNCRNTKVHTTANGIVSFTGYRGSYGNLVIIDHQNFYSTYYAHLNKFIVYKNQYVEKGDLIGYMGCSGRTTGVHLHYEVRYKGRPINPIPFVK